jgi:hypothetical protein
MKMHGVPQGLINPPWNRPIDPLEEEAHETGRLPAQGTVILVAIFLLAFVTYYFVNWNVLSFLWKLG